MTEPFVVRPATLADAPLVHELTVAVDLEDIGSSAYSLEEVVTDMSGFGIQLPEDSWLAFAGDRLVASALLWNEGRGERVDVDHYVRRDALPAGERLIDLASERAADVAAANGVAEAVIHLGLSPKSLLAQGPLERRGWRPVRRYNVLTRPVAASVDVVPSPPVGVTLRRSAGDEADRRLLHRLLEEAFAEHFDHTPLEFEPWCERMQFNDTFDWSLVWIASLTGGDRIGDGVGADVGALVARDRETMGWVGTLGVVKAARGRGVASHLLRTAFAEFACRGRDEVGLSVDTENVTGALRLYEGLGMTLRYAVDMWEARVPATGSAGAPASVQSRQAALDR